MTTFGPPESFVCWGLEEDNPLSPVGRETGGGDLLINMMDCEVPAIGVFFLQRGRDSWSHFCWRSLS